MHFSCKRLSYSRDSARHSRLQTAFDKMTRKRPLRSSRSFKITDFGIDRKPVCDFLLVNDTNLHPISHRLTVITKYWSHYPFCQILMYSFTGDA